MKLGRMTETRQREVEISGVETSVFIHATEDEGKVERAVVNIIPVEDRGPKVQRLRGHFKDPIILMMTKIRKRKAAREAFRSLIRALSPLDRRRLIDEAEDRVDKAGTLYMRFDKQRAFRGKAVLHETDPIRVKIRFRLSHGADPVRAVRASIVAVIDEIEDGSEKTGLLKD